jgi:hypothetical protein
MVAVHLATHTLRARLVIEKRRRVGAEIAYSTENPLHLPNVPAGKRVCTRRNRVIFLSGSKSTRILRASYHRATRRGVEQLPVGYSFEI